MGVFISNAITDRGRILLGEAQVGATFEATRIVMGSGFIPAGYTARTMTAVVAPVIELAINKKKRAGDGTVTFGGVYSNENITEAFYFREFALYARVEYADGTYSDEVLYSYGNAGDNADLMPAYSTSTVVEKQMDLVTWVGNDTVVNLSITGGLYIPTEEKGQPYGVATLDEDGVLDLSHRSKLLTNEDLNDIVADGYYRARTTQECLNVPDDVTAFGLLVLRIGENMDTGGNCNQILVPYGSVGNIIYTRIATEGAWDNWRRIALMDNVVNKTGDHMSGDLSVHTPSPRMSVVSTTNNNGTYIMSYGDAEVGEIGYETGEIGTVIRFFGADNDDANAIKLIRHGDGFWNQYNIMHTGNAPVVTATAELV